MPTGRKALRHQTGTWRQDSGLREELSEASKVPNLESCRLIVEQGIQAKNHPNIRTGNLSSLCIRNKAEIQLLQ